MFKQLIRGLCLLAVLCLGAVPIWAQAQGSSADLTGTVFDPSKALIKGATVTATNVETMLTRVVTSGPNGVYRISLLPPGTYEVKSEAQGFSPQVKRGVTLTVGQTAVINFELPLGVKMEVEVIDTSVPLLEMERTHQASTITQKPINNLPINGRNFLDFAKLTPGVSDESPLVTKVAVPQIPTSGLSFGGQNGRANSVLIDGVDNNDIASNGVRPTISQEAVREYQINRQGYNPEFGRASAGTINLVTKSGTSKFHGNVYNYFRNEQLDARNTFATSASQDPPFKRNQPGFTLGGPLRAKAFFFVSHEGLYRRESAITTILSDPSILQPTSGQQALINALLGSGNPALGVRLQNMLNIGPNAQPPFQRNLATYQFLNNATGIFPIRENSSTSNLRIDQAFNEQDYLLFRYSFTNDAIHGVGVGGLQSPSRGYDIGIIDHGFVVGETHLFSGGSANELRFQFVRNTFNANTVDPYGPQYNLFGIGTLGRDFSAPSDRRQYRTQLLDNFSLMRGKNRIKFGGDFNRYSFKVNQPIFGGGNIDFSPIPVPLGAILDPAYTGQVLTALGPGGLNRPDLQAVLGQNLTVVQLLNYGFPASLNQGYGNPSADLSGYLFGTYAQDGVQLKPNLFLNFGLRYDYDKPPAGVNRDRNNFSPRIGFSYDPFKSGKTVIRGGGGMFYQPLFTATAFISTILGGGQISNILVTADPLISPIDPNSFCGRQLATSRVPPSACFYQSLAAQGVITLPSTSTIPESAYQQLLGLNRAGSVNRAVLRLADNVVNPYSFQGSIGIDHEFGRDFFVSVNYQLNHGVNLIRSRQINALPNPNRLDALGRPSLTGRADQTKLIDYIYETGGNSIYHSMQVEVNRKFGRYYQLIGAYTLSKAIDDATDLAFGQGPQDPTNPGADRGLSAFDVRQRLTLTSLIDSPFKGGSGKPLYQRVLANFYFSPIATVRSGFPFNIVTGIDVNLDNNINDRPFAVGRNTGLGPGFFAMDLRIGRRFPLGADGSRSIEAIFDTFNLFNRANYKDLNNNTSGQLYLDRAGFSDVRVAGCTDRATSALCGFTAAYDPRIIQLAVKLNF
ncbi:MAG TPA: carboxypeptidase regulatory-like domain-containing protein [Blastocatellia bacterium]|nr:carboxypeptidase regulatory-like domain-containing protein [Blastocatellia bacterium]